MSDLPLDPARDEYIALRATIRERGSLRVVLFVTALGIWGSLLVAATAVMGIPAAVLIPLVALAGGFEAVASLHVGVERIGRYVQVRHEGEAGSTAGPLTGWERTAMEWGRRRFPGTGTDPLFSVIFYLAAAVNFVPVAPVALTGVTGELIVLALAHVAFAWRVQRLGAWAGRQRAEDLARYQQLLAMRQDPERGAQGPSASRLSEGYRQQQRPGSPQP